MKTIKLLNINLKKSKNFIYREDVNPLQIASENLFSLYDKPIEDSLKFNVTKKFGNIHLVKSIEKEAWNLLPINTHEVIDYNSKAEKELSKAFSLLKKVPSWLSLKKFVGGICMVRLRNIFKTKDTQITSLSIPTFPFILFISDKVNVHTPPNNLREPSFAFLAENILHEATHQALNLNLIERDILNEDYDSDQSPMIEIPWRKNQSIERNKKWQIDRCLHAACVYLIVGDFRKRMLDQNQKEYNKTDFVDALENSSLLISSIKKHRELFNNINLLESIEEDLADLNVQ